MAGISLVLCFSALGRSSVKITKSKTQPASVSIIDLIISITNDPNRLALSFQAIKWPRKELVRDRSVLVGRLTGTSLRLVGFDAQPF